MCGDQCQHATRFEGVNGLGEEEIMERQLLPAIVQFDISERHIADDRVEAAFGQACVAKVLDADVLLRVKCFGNAPGDQVQLDADEAHPVPRHAHEVARAAAWFLCGHSGYVAFTSSSAAIKPIVKTGCHITPPATRCPKASRHFCPCCWYLHQEEDQSVEYGDWLRWTAPGLSH